eukprot:scaffold9976_cov22-Tisochrysis_lutea.AAC.1
MQPASRPSSREERVKAFRAACSQSHTRPSVWRSSPHPGLLRVIHWASLSLCLQSSIDMSIWEEKQPKIQSFFGPGIVARVTK